MGLADRFRLKLEQNDLFTTEEKETRTQENNVYEFVSNTVSENSNDKKFEDLETDVIRKIRNTPCWAEFNSGAQKNMISNYFEAKVKRKDISYTSIDKANFIKNILDLVSVR